MDKIKKSSCILLIIAIVLMLVSMVGASAVQSNFGRTDVKTVDFETSYGKTMSGLLLVPKGASAENKAPTVVMCHGFYNNKEMQDAYYVELARRGFVVLSIDMLSHGNSERVPDLGGVIMSVNEAMSFVSTLPYADLGRVGVEGHSLGAASCNAAVGIDNLKPQPLIAAVVSNGTDATYTNSETGEFENIYGSRDVAVIAEQFDEFSFSVTDEKGVIHPPSEFVNFANAQSFLHFGTEPDGSDIREANRVYTEKIDGTEAMRVIYTPNCTHAWSHFSTESTKAIIEFFDISLEAPISIASTNQIWQYKELFNFVGLVGFAMFIANFAVCMLFTSAFESLRLEKALEGRRLAGKNIKWRYIIPLASAAFAALTYVFVCDTLMSTAFFKLFATQNTVFAIAVWAALCGIFNIVLLTVYRLCGGKKEPGYKESGFRIPISKLGKSVVLALLTITVSFAWVFAADYFFKTDFRLWVLAAKAFRADAAVNAVFPYMFLFLIYFISSSLMSNSFGYAVTEGKTTKGNLVISAVLTVLPVALLLAIQYITFFSTGHLAINTPAGEYTIGGGALALLWLIPLLGILPASTIISRKIYRVTGNPYLPAIICGAVATLMSCTNTCTWG